MPGLSVELSLTALGSDGTQELTLHYAIVSEVPFLDGHEGDINLPFEHGYITNRWFYVHPDPDINYDVQGYANVSRLSSGYSLQFGLTDLNDTFVTQAAPKTNDIHQQIYRASGFQFADINLVFHPQLLYNEVAFDITMAPQWDTGDHWPYPGSSNFTGTLPVPYGSYHFWFYRDSKN